MSHRETTPAEKDYSRAYAGNIFKIIFFAALLIVMAVIITGAVSYTNTRRALITKAKSQDMVYIVKYMSEKIQGLISRAVETSYIIARDPFNVEWLEGGEQDTGLGKNVLKRLEDTALSYDYQSTFIAGLKTRHYYYKENTPDKDRGYALYTLSDKNPSDVWFFNTIASKQPISLNVDYNRGMDDTLLFVNALIGDPDKPAGITGVGLSLKEISNEFQDIKFGKRSSLWMLDKRGIIQLSDDLLKRGRNFNEYVPANVAEQINKNVLVSKYDTLTSEYVNTNGETIDFVCHKLKSTDWILFYQLPRSESTSVIDNLRISMIVTIVLVLLFFVAVLYVVSRKIANPYKQALLLNAELERKVGERTQELTAINEKVMDSIYYSKRMQESILPSTEEMNRVFKEYSVIWSPRDVVGGDFYWLREFEDTAILVVGDCTGHGVPGALMTMTVNAILYHIVTNINSENPVIILKELDRLLKEALNKSSSSTLTDDGLDIAICCIRNQSEILYAGAKMDLWVKDDRELNVYRGLKSGIGYSRTKLDDNMEINVHTIKEGEKFILTSDGFVHQNGGIKDYPFGIKRFSEVLKNSEAETAESLKSELRSVLDEYRKDEPQRDDIVLIAFKVK